MTTDSTESGSSDQMANDPPNDPVAPAGDTAVPRPRTVDYAAYALLATALFSIATAIARNLSEAWVVKSYRSASQYKSYTPEKLHQTFENSKTPTMISFIVVAAIFVLLGKLLRDGKNWSRWVIVVLLVFPLLPTAYLIYLKFLVSDAPAGLRVAASLTGLGAAAVIVLLFLPSSTPYFRTPGRTSAPGFAGMFKPLLSGAGGSARSAAGPPAPKPLAEPGAKPGRPSKAAPGGKRSAPRAKSRKAAE